MAGTSWEPCQTAKIKVFPKKQNFVVNYFRKSANIYVWKVIKYAFDVYVNDSVYPPANFGRFTEVQTVYLVQISTKRFNQSFTKYRKLNMKNNSHGCFQWKMSDNCNCQLGSCNSCHSSSCPSYIPKIKIKISKCFSAKFDVKHDIFFRYPLITWSFPSNWFYLAVI